MVDAFIVAHRNANTQATFASGWRQFERWATTIESPLRHQSAAVDTTHPSDVDIASYLQYIGTVRNASTATVTAAVAAIADHIRLDVAPSYNPCASVRVRRMRAVLVPMAKPATKKKEITWAQLQAIHTRCTDTPPSTVAGHLARRDSCMFMLAYFTFLRTSEIARMTRADITITRERIDTVDTDILRVHVNRMCKNDAERRGHERIVAAKPHGHQCLVRQMREYIKLLPSSTLLFTTKAGTAMSADTPRGRLRHWLTAIGVTNAMDYGFHSIRAGAATDAATAGVEERNIKEHGNWKSDAYRGYIRPSVQTRLTVGAALGDHTPVTDDIDEAEYEIDTITAHRRCKRGMQYLVHWKGYPASQATWEPELGIKGASRALSRYHSSHKPATTTGRA